VTQRRHGVDRLTRADMVNLRASRSGHPMPVAAVLRIDRSSGGLARLTGPAPTSDRVPLAAGRPVASAGAAGATGIGPALLGGRRRLRYRTPCLPG
jgi:hypothetical protein